MASARVLPMCATVGEVWACGAFRLGGYVRFCQRSAAWL